jgi:hypothetical protein
LDVGQHVQQHLWTGNPNKLLASTANRTHDWCYSPTHPLARQALLTRLTVIQAAEAKTNEQVLSEPNGNKVAARPIR